MRIPLPMDSVAWHCIRRSFFKRLTDGFYPGIPISIELAVSS